MDKWKPVETHGLPTETELWLWNGKVVYRGQYHWTFTKNGKATKEFIKKLKIDGVTHWMRIDVPEPPNKLNTI